MPGLTDRRIGFLFVVFVALLGLATLRAGWLGAVRSPALKRAAATQQVQTVALPAARGTISDRHGAVLAVSEPASDVSATPYLVEDKLRAAGKLAPLLRNATPDEVLAKLSEQSGFVYLARRLPAAQAAKVGALHIDGIALTPSSLRTYPRSWLASQVLGSASEDPGGGSGLEYGEDRVLRGQDGVRRVVSDALGQPISIKDEHPTVPGKDVELTLDAGLQEKVESVLEGVGQVYKPKGATAIVMDPRTSQILALANWPRVDANDPSGAPPYATQDRAVGFTYEPGSTFKAFTVAGAIDDGTVTPDTPIFVPYQLVRLDRTLHDAEAHGDETLTVTDILKQSSNIGAALIAWKHMGATRFSQWVSAFGFGTPTGVALPGEERGIVPTYAQYSGTSIINLPIGQGQLVTPMQMVAAYAAIANGGILRAPQIVRSIGGQPVRRPGGPPRDLRADGRERARDAAQRRRVRRHRVGGGDRGLRPRRQDGHGEQGRPGHRPVLRHALRRLVHGLRARARPAAARGGRRRRAAGRDLRRPGRRARVPEDRRVRAALPRDQAELRPASPARSERVGRLGAR